MAAIRGMAMTGTAIVGVARESAPGEGRIAITPAVVPVLRRARLEVCIEAGAGAVAGFDDAEYEAQGARVLATADEIFDTAAVLLCVRTPRTPSRGLDAGRLRAGQTLVGLLDPLAAPQAMQALAERGVDALALELLPRSTRAQSMDALSSMATVAGYRAVLLAAAAAPKMFPMLITAAGTITPARVLVVGAGVAGLHAIATARRLGAVVRACDVRPAAQEEVESLGARFLALPPPPREPADTGGYATAQDESFYRRQREALAHAVAESNVIITTAAVPGHRAPVLIGLEQVARMAPGSVIVDLAAATGGNCEVTRPGETVAVGGITVMGPLDLPAGAARDASQLYARNVSAFLLHLVRDGTLRLDSDDEITAATLVTRAGTVVHPQVQSLLHGAVNRREDG